MSYAPWIDIPWKGNVKEALFGKAHAPTMGSKYYLVVRAVEEYHLQKKDVPQNFSMRAILLKGVVDAATKAAGEAKSQGHREYLRKLAERAAGKAQYLRDIEQYLKQNADQVSDIHGFIEAMSAKRAPTVQMPPPPQQGWQRAGVGGGAFAMAGSVAFEQMDPYHRAFEVDLERGKNPWKGAHGRGIGIQMVEWVNRVLNNGYDKPFLAYLEISDACFHALSAGQEAGQVLYASDGKLLAETSMVSLINGALLETKASGERRMFDTSEATHGKAGDYHAKAFIITVTGDMIAGIHEGGKMHHSSLNGGGLVRCAGMIGAKNGMVTYVDSNSGHYRPPAANVFAFLKFLNDFGLLAPNAMTTVQGSPMTIVNYLRNPARTFYGKETLAGTHRK